MKTFSPDCLKGRTILITGGCGALGCTVVKALASHGARVAVNDLWPAPPEPLPEGAVYLPADATDEAAVLRLFRDAADKLGPLDIVCCHAGMVEAFPIADYPLERWQKLMDTNLKSSFLVARESARHLRGRGTRERPLKILFTSSWVQDTPWPEISAYNASKSAIKMLMRTMARELAADHVTVNSIAPGIVAAGLAQRQWDTDPGYRARAQRAIPLGAMQAPESVADAFLFLCSDASNYITGATLLVDGGCSLYPMD